MTNTKDLLYDLLFAIAKWATQETGILEGSPEYALILGIFLLAVFLKLS
jgi:hypothetical protein